MFPASQWQSWQKAHFPLLLVLLFSPSKWYTILLLLGRFTLSDLADVSSRWTAVKSVPRRHPEFISVC